METFTFSDVKIKSKVKKAGLRLAQSPDYKKHLDEFSKILNSMLNEIR